MPEMVTLRWGTVVAVGDARPGAVELEVEVNGARAPGLAYPDLVGPVERGDRVLLNVTAVELGLGTGGVHLVVAVDSERHSPPSVAGRVMKEWALVKDPAVAGEALVFVRGGA